MEHIGICFPVTCGVPLTERKTNGFAVASLTLALLWPFWLGSLAAVVFGFIALRQLKRAGGTQRGRTPAIISVVLGLGVLAISIDVLIDNLIA